MIGTSLPEYLFVRASIFVLRFFIPLVVSALILTLIIDHNATGLTLLLEIIAIAELVFYILVCLPKYRLLQQPARHPRAGTREERRRLFDRCAETIADPETYLVKWFNNAPLESIRRENVKEFYAWAFLNRGDWGPDEEPELESYADKVEELLGRKLPPGVGTACPIKLTLDPVNILHRPLVWYTIISLVDAVTYLRLLANGFTFYRLRLVRFLTVFPFRIVTLCSRRASPSDTLSYWLRPHTASTRLPVLFIHGIGVGLHPYVSFLAAINRALPHDSPDGQIGVLAVELMPISARLTGSLPTQDALVREILAILDRHGWDQFVLATHSFGSVVATNLLHDRVAARRIATCLLVDPVTFLLHEPAVAYNFTRRMPKTAPQWQVHYFASTDACVAYTLARRFFWARNILWKEELHGRKATVALSGRDCIVDAESVGKYLAGEARGFDRFVAEDETNGAMEDGEGWRSLAWRGEGLDVLWFGHADHAQVFERKGDYKRLVEVLRAYSAGVDQ